MDQYKRSIILNVATKGRTAKQNMLKQLNDVFHSVDMDIASGKGKEVNVLYSFGNFHSDDQIKIDSDEAMEAYIRKSVPGINFRVVYADVYRDNPDAVLQALDEEKEKNIDVEKEVRRQVTLVSAKAESKYSRKEAEQQAEVSKLELYCTTLESQINEAEVKYNLLEKSQGKRSDTSPFSNHPNPDELLNELMSASRQKVIDDHVEYAENTEALGYDNTLEYVIMLVENSGNLSDDKSKFFKRKILKADRETNIFSSSEELREILIHYDLKKRDDTLENIYDSVQQREAAIEQNQQDEPEAVKEARKVLEVYEGLPPVIKEATKELHKISLGIVNDYTVQITDDDSEIKKEQVIDKGIIKLIENYSDLLEESEIMFSDVKKLINNRDERSETDWLYFGTRVEDHSEEQSEPIPREVAEALSYTIEELISRNMTSLSSDSEEGA